MTDRRIIAILSSFTALLFADVLFFGRNFYERDLFRYHFPMKRIVRDTVLAGEFPFWNRLFAAGQPMAANPAYEVFYPGQWLIFIGSYELGFALHIVAHVLLAAIGMYLLIGCIGCRPAVACFAAISFAFGGFLLGSMSTLPTFFVWAWAPLAGWAVVGVMRGGSVAVAALILGLQMLIGEPVALLQVWGLCGAAAVSAAVASRRDSTRDTRVAPLVLAFAWAIAIAAVQLIPGLDHARDSVRSRGLPFDVVVDFSMPPLRVFELLIPQIVNVVQFERAPYLASLSCGVAVGLLALGGVIARVKGWVLFVTVSTVSYVLAIGDATPLYRWLYDAGIGRSLRYPEKFIASMVFASVVFAAVVAERTLDRFPRRAVYAVGLLLLIGAVVRGRQVSPSAPREFFRPPPIAAGLRNAVVFHRGEWNASDPNFSKVHALPVSPATRAGLVPLTPASWGIRSVLELDYDETALLPTHEMLDVLKRRGNSGRPDWADELMAISGATHVLDYRDPAEGEILRATPVRSYGRYYGTRITGVVETANTATIDVEAPQPALLVAAVTRHKYWQATLDGNATGLLPANVAYQAVRVPAGKHRVVMRYRNPLVLYSGIVSLLAAIAATATILRRPRPRLQNGS